MVHFRFSAAVVMSAVYDYEPSPQNDSMVSILKNYIRASVPGMALAKIFLIKAFPFCMCMLLIEETTLLKLYGKVLHIPEWLPGSWIRREASEAYGWRNKMVETPYRYARERMVSLVFTREQKWI